MLKLRRGKNRKNRGLEAVAFCAKSVEEDLQPAYSKGGRDAILNNFERRQDDKYGLESPRVAGG